MAKKKISVNGDKELIEKLNSKIKTIKSEEKSETVATLNIKEELIEENKLMDEQTKTDESIDSGTVIVEDYNFNDPNKFYKVESNRQRNIKYNHYDKYLEDADAYTKSFCERMAKYFNSEWRKNEKDIKTLTDILGPDMVNLLERINQINTNEKLKENASCRHTIDKEIGIPAFDEIGYLIPDKPVTEEFKKVLDASRKISDKIKDIKNSNSTVNSIKTMSNDVESVINDILSPKKDLTTSEYEMVNHPKHYNNYEYEVIEMMRRIYGDEKTAIFCELNAFKYRMRMGTKPTSPIEEDLEKEQWYLNKKQELIKK